MRAPASQERDKRFRKRGRISIFPHTKRLGNVAPVIGEGSSARLRAPRESTHRVHNTAQLKLPMRRSPGT
eukprot:4087694-Pyramimonas_sp.AAC.2